MQPITGKGYGTSDFVFTREETLRRLISDVSSHFTSALATGESAKVSIPGLLSNKIKIRALRLYSKQALRYRLSLYGTDQFSRGVLGNDRFQGMMEVNLESYQDMPLVGEIQGASVPEVGYVSSIQYLSNAIKVSDDIALVVFGLNGGDYVWATTYRVNPDNSIRKIDNQIISWSIGTQSIGQMVKVHGSDNLYAFACCSYGEGSWLKVLRVEPDGGIGGVVASERLSSVSPSNALYTPGICHIEGYLYATCWTRKYGTTYRCIEMGTRTISPEGSISSQIDYRIMPLYRRHGRLFLLSPNVLMVSHYSDGAGNPAPQVTTIRVEPNGLFGPNFIESGRQIVGTTTAGYVAYKMFNIRDQVRLFVGFSGDSVWASTMKWDDSGQIGRIPYNIDTGRLRIISSNGSSSQGQESAILIGLNKTRDGYIFLTTLQYTRSPEVKQTCLATFEVKFDGTITPGLISEEGLSPQWGLSPVYPDEMLNYPQIVSLGNERYFIWYGRRRWTGPAYDDFELTNHMATFQVTGPPDFYSDLRDSLELDYEDLDGTRELHVELANLSAASKIAGNEGEVFLELVYSPMM
jgi:hypothetical protein